MFRVSGQSRDLWGRLTVGLCTLCQAGLTCITTCLSYGKAWVWRIDIGDHCIFCGQAMFWRTPESVIEIGDNCRFRSAIWSNKVGVNRPCMVSTLRPGARVSIGRHCGFTGTVVAAAEYIEIGDWVLCGANTTITDTDWHCVDPEQRRAPGAASPVHIANNVWLGMGVVVLKGVRIGEGAVVAANSVVTQDIPARVVAAGQPARVVRPI